VVVGTGGDELEGFVGAKRDSPHCRHQILDAPQLQRHDVNALNAGIPSGLPVAGRRPMQRTVTGHEARRDQVPVVERGCVSFRVPQPPQTAL
jgi:hypothetical protein